MTALAITPNFDKKTAKFKGAIAAGEHVAVTIQNDGEYVASTTNLRLRVVDPVCGKTLAIFPQPVEEGETPETWDSDLTPLSCELNLNTDRMLKAVPPAVTVPLLFVLDDKEADTLYFKDMCEVTHWPMVRGEDEPYNLDDYPDIIEDFKDRLADAESDIADAVSDVAQAVESVNTAIDGIDGKVSAAVSSAVPAAVADKADKVEDAVAGNFAGLNSSGNLTDSGKKPADFAPASHVADGDIHVTAAQKTAWSAKQDAISDLSDIRSKANSAYQVPDGGIPKSALHAEVQESLGKADITASEILGCINAAEFNSDSKKIVFKHGTTVVAEIDATAFVKDGMVSSVEIVDDNLVITFNTDAGLDPISIPLTEIFDPDNYYTKTAANNKFKTRQTPVQSPPTESTPTNAFIDTISQNANGVITPTKRGVATVAPASATDSGQVADALAVKNALAGKASTADATLTQHYTDWVCSPATSAYEEPYFVAWDLIPETDIYAWCLFAGIPGDADFVNVGTETADAISFTATGRDEETVTATRTASGYDLGDQDDKPLASEAEAVALRTGKMSASATGADILVGGSGGAASSSIASAIDDLLRFKAPLDSPTFTGTPVAPTAAAGENSTLIATTAFVQSEKRYTLPESATAISTASSEVVSGETVYYGAATLADRTQNQVAVLVALDELRVTIPPAVSGKVRDFGLIVVVGLGEGTALAAPALVPVAPTGETITMMNAEGEMPTLADGTTTASGLTVLYFTEIGTGAFLVKGEQIQGVA